MSAVKVGDRIRIVDPYLAQGYGLNDTAVVKGVDAMGVDVQWEALPDCNVTYLIHDEYQVEAAPEVGDTLHLICGDVDRAITRIEGLVDRSATGPVTLHLSQAHSFLLKTRQELNNAFARSKA